MSDAIKYHECGHAAVALRFGANVSEIKAGPLSGHCNYNFNILATEQHALTIAAGAASMEYFGFAASGTLGYKLDGKSDDEMLYQLGYYGKRYSNLRSAATGLVCQLEDQIRALKSELDKQSILTTQDLARIVHTNPALAAFKYLYDKTPSLNFALTSSVSPHRRQPAASDLGCPKGFMRVGGWGIN